MISGRATYKVDEDGIKIVGVFDGKYGERRCRVMPYGFANKGAMNELGKREYVVNIEDSDLRSITKQKVVKFETERPPQVAYLRDDIEKLGYITYECFDTETEILTKEGWKSWMEIGDSECVATVDMKKNKLEFKKIRDKIVRKYKGKMVRFNGKYVNLFVTPKHNIILSNGGSFIKVKAIDFIENKKYIKKLFRKGYRIYRGVEEYEESDVDFSEKIGIVYNKDGRKSKKFVELNFEKKEKFYEFFGLYLAEGSIDKNYIVLSLNYKNKEEVEMAMKIAKEIGLKPCVCKSSRSVNIKASCKKLAEFIIREFGSGSKNKRIPSWIKNSRKEYLERFIHMYMMGDGRIENGKYRSCTTSSKQLANDLQECFMKLGYGAIVNRKKRYDERTNKTYEIYRVYVSKRSVEINPNESVSLERYDGIVWCVNVEPHHTVIVRRRGKAIVCGNCDIPFVRRLLIDKELKVKYDSVSYIDIEVDDRLGVPSEHGKHEILCIGLGEEWLWRGDYDTEREMLEDFNKLLEKKRIGVLAGWNVDFDYYHLLKRMENLGVNFGRLAFTEKIDILNRYRFAIKGLESYSLGEVAKHEGLKEKKGEGMRVSEMSKDELYEYNMRDVELVREIDERYGFSEVRLELANYCNLMLEMCTPVQLADTLVLRRLRELGYVALNVREVEKREYLGAFVDAREYGVVENVVYLDVAGMYPNIIVNEMIDIDGFKGEVYPHILKSLMEQREKHRERWKKTGDKKEKTMQEMLKPVINAFYGALGNTYFRWCDFDKAEQVTKKGREILLSIDEFLKDNGFDVVYMDTDGVFVRVNEASYEVAESVAKLVNAHIKPYMVKVEEVLEKIIFFKSGESAAKKRYWGRTIDGKEIVRGVEVRRGDWCRLAKEVQRDLINMVFDGKEDEELLKYLSNVRKNLYNKKYDSKLVIVKGFKKKDEYKNLNLPHLRALAKARDAFIDGKVRFVYANGDVEPIVNESDLEKYNINYDYYWQSQIMAVARRIFDSIGVNGVITKSGVYKQVRLC